MWGEGLIPLILFLLNKCLKRNKKKMKKRSVPAFQQLVVGLDLWLAGTRQVPVPGPRVMSTGSQQRDLGVCRVLSDWGWAGGSTRGYWGCRGLKDGEEVFGGLGGAPGGLGGAGVMEAGGYMGDSLPNCVGFYSLEPRRIAAHAASCWALLQAG